MTDNGENKRRTIRMTDLMWETLADLAEHNHRTIGEEIRAACHEHIVANDYDFDEERAPRTTVGGFRQMETAA